MHATALINLEKFLATYVPPTFSGTILDVGSRDINGSLRPTVMAHAPSSRYLGVDILPGPGVDLLMADPCVIPLPASSSDLVLCSSTLEHTEFFWLLFLDMLRVLRPGGLLYCCAPSRGFYHPFPLDYWRFYPDSTEALVHWAVRSGYGLSVVSTYITIFSNPEDASIPDEWQDWVAIFKKGVAA
jgi:SAM-dependent methyltransferase